MLEVKNLTKTYVPKKGVPVVALNDVSLRIEDKGLVFILGKSGSGKSTLLNLLGGLDKYDDGDIIIKGKSTKDFSQADFDSYRNTYVGFVFQEYNILDEFSVGANIALAIELQGRKASNEEVNQILDTLDLKGYGNRRTNELSGGQKQRIAIARALVKNPDIILADEPTGALDSKTGLQIFDILKKLSEEKLVLVVSHDREFAEMYGDRVIELADGKIISDITKTTVKNGETEENLQYVEKEGIVVKEGYQLIPKDLEMINHYLQKEKNLSIISKPEDEFQKQEVFVETKSDFALKTYVDDFKMIKSRLPFRMAFKMGASGLNHKKFRLFITILLSLVAFTLFGVTDSLAAYNKVDATVNSIIDGEIDVVAFAKTRMVEVDGYNRISDLSISKENIEDLNQKIGQAAGLNFKPIFAAGADSYQGAFIIENNYSSSTIRNYVPFYLDSLSGVAEYTKAELLELGFTVHGELPTEDDEIAVTSYIFDHFYEFGYGYYDDNPTIDIKAENFNRYEDLIGRYINLRSYNLPGTLKFKVTGIVDTNLKSERYESLKDPQEGYGDYFLMEEFKTVIQYGYHGLGFVNQGLIDKLIANQDDFGLRLGNNIYLSYYSPNQDMWFSSETVAVVSNFDEEKVFFFDEEKTELEENEIIVEWYQFMYTYQKQDFTYGDYTGRLLDYEDVAFMNLIRQYAEENYSEADIEGMFLGEYDSNSLSVQDKIEFYYSYLVHGNGYMINEFGDKNGYEFLDEIPNAYRPLFQQIDEISIQKEFNNNFLNEKDSEVVKIVGLYRSDENVHNNTIIIDDDFYTEIESYAKPEPYKYALAKMPSSREAIKKIVEFSLELENGISFPLRNASSPMLETANNLVENTAKVFLYVGIAFAGFSALMLSNFIASSVSFKKREIGILRALGARSSDVFRIFFNESIVIAIINFVLASISTFIVVMAINKSLRVGVGLTITVFNFSIRQVILLLLITVFVAIVASFLPVNKIARKKPVDAISNK